jgi:hypothetical protein
LVLFVTRFVAHHIWRTMNNADDIRFTTTTTSQLQQQVNYNNNSWCPSPCHHNRAANVLNGAQMLKLEVELHERAPEKHTRTQVQQEHEAATCW